MMATRQGKMSEASALSVVRRAVSESDLAWLTDRSYTWFKTTLLPAIRIVGASARGHRRRQLAADGYVELGDIYDVYFNAPGQALRAYRRSLELAPENSCAWREVGCMQRYLGKYRSAKRALRRSLEIDPSDEAVRIDLEYVDRHIREKTPALYSRSDPVHTAAELIAQGRARSALRRLERKLSVPARRCRVRAFEALEDHESALREWAKIGCGRGTVELDQADWFFVSDGVWNAPRFWEAMLEIGARFGRGLYPKDDSFPETKDRERRPGSVEPPLRVYRRRWRLSARLHLARTRGDANVLRRLASSYPSWTLAQECLLGIESR